MSQFNEDDNLRIWNGEDALVAVDGIFQKEFYVINVDGEWPEHIPQIGPGDPIEKIIRVRLFGWLA